MVFLPGLHLLACCTAYPLTPVRRGGAVELGWRLWNWWSRPPRPRRGILIFHGERPEQRAMARPDSGFWPLLRSTARRLQAAPGGPLPAALRLSSSGRCSDAYNGARHCQPVPGWANVMFPPSATLLLVRLGRGCQSGASPSRLAAAICFDCLSKRKCRFLPDQSSLTLHIAPLSWPLPVSLSVPTSSRAHKKQMLGQVRGISV